MTYRNGPESARSGDVPRVDCPAVRRGMRPGHPHPGIGRALDYPSASAGVAESADAADLNSAARKGVRVQIPAPAPCRAGMHASRRPALRRPGCRQRDTSLVPQPIASLLMRPLRLPYGGPNRTHRSPGGDPTGPPAFSSFSASSRDDALPPADPTQVDGRPICQRRRRNRPPERRSSVDATAAIPSGPKALVRSRANRSAATDRGAPITTGIPSLTALR